MFKQKQANDRMAEAIKPRSDFFGVSADKIIIFAKYLAIMLRSGLVLSEALKILHDQSNGPFQKIIAGLIDSLQAGNSFSEALKAYPRIFPDVFVSAVIAGEASGTLEINLQAIAQQMEAEKEFRARIKGMLAYPAIIVVTAVLLGLLIALYVLPKIIPLFGALHVDLPLSTRVLIYVSGLFQESGGRILIGTTVFFASVVFISRQNFFKPVSHFVLLRLPLVGRINRSVSLAGFSQMLALLLKSGLAIDQAFAVLGRSLENYYYRKCLSELSDQVLRGATLSESLAEHPGYFPVLFSSMIGVGERSGNLDEVLVQLGKMYQDEADRAAKFLAGALEPALLFAIGILVGGLALAIITPIYQITGSFH